MGEPLKAWRLWQRRESVCRGGVSVIEAMKVSVEAVRVLIKANKVPVNSLLQAKRVLVDCRGLESALEAVRVSVEAVRVHSHGLN